MGLDQVAHPQPPDPHGAVAGGAHGVFHLHGLDGHQHVALLDLLPVDDAHGDDGAGHGGA